MAEATRTPFSRYATWITESLDSAADRVVASPAGIGVGVGLIGFGGGQPAAELYPLEALERAFSRAILEDGRKVLPYGPSEGLPALREIVATRLGARGIKIGPENVVILSGSLQGLHLMGRMTLNHGDTIVTEAPTFMGALTTWEHQQPRYLTIPVDAGGMQTTLLAEALARAPQRPRFVYLLPTFQNPSGVSMSLERREHLLEIAREHDLLIIEDDPYGEFWFDEGNDPIPPLRSLPGSEDRVVYLGTFSKILAPGFRLAYAVAPPEIVELLARGKRGIDFHTDGLLQQAVVRLITDGEFDLEAHIAKGRRIYKQRRDAMLDSLEATFSADTRWTRPAGGFFMWIDLPDHLSGDAVTEAAMAQGVAVYPGSVFYPNHDGGKSGLRLSYSDASPELIREGIQRLKRAVDAVER